MTIGRRGMRRGARRAWKNTSDVCGAVLRRTRRLARQARYRLGPTDIRRTLDELSGGEVPVILLRRRTLHDRNHGVAARIS